MGSWLRVWVRPRTAPRRSARLDASRRVRAVTALVAALASAVVLPLGTESAAAAPAPAPGSSGRVLILASTVTGGSASTEAQEAAADGYGVDVVDGATWDSMSTADFAAYKAVILGDPTCTESPSAYSAAASNAAVWGAAVTGHVEVIGSDPVYHQTYTNSAIIAVTQRAVDFALSSPAGTTGAYISLSCYYAGASANSPVPLLSDLAVAGGQTFTVQGAGCYDSIDIVADSPALSGITNSLLSNWECSVHEVFDSWPASFGVLAIDTTTGSAYEAADGTFGDPYILAFPGGAVGSASDNFGGGNESSYQDQCNTADPVNCASGDFWETFTDGSVPGAGVPLDLTRTYNSLGAATSSPFGDGWSSSYTMSLATGGVNATVTQENGSTIEFGRGSTPGSFVAPPRFFATLVQNPDGTYTFTRRRTQVFTFSATGQLLAETDPDGYKTTLSYASGQLTTVTDASGRSLSFTYTADGHVATVTDPLGAATTYSYDSAGDLTSVTTPGGRTTEFSYDIDHRLLTRTDPAGGVLTNVYDSQGRVTSQTDPMGHTTTFAYTLAGTTITDPDGHVTVQDYTQGRLVAETCGYGTAQAATWHYTYDPATAAPVSVTDPAGHVMRFTYDDAGNRTSSTDPLGRVSTASYNQFSEPISVTDPAGTTSTASYDSHGNLLSASVSDGSTTLTTTLSYGDPAHPGLPTSWSDAASDSWHLSYDANGDLASRTDPLGNTTTYHYDIDGHLVLSTTPQGNTTTYAYDGDGDPVSQTDPLGRTADATYGPNGDLATLTDSNGNTTRYTYDANGEQTRVTRADGTTVAYSYDPDGNPVSQTNAVGASTTYAYDSLNRITSVTDPLGDATRYSYDAAGNLATVTDPNGTLTTYGYDADAERTTISYSDGTPGISYTYNVLGERTSMADGTGTTAYSYDPLGRLLAQTDGAGQMVSYSYDLAGNVASVGYPNGKTVTRTYDANGRLTSVTDWLGNTTTFGYNDTANTTSETYANGITAQSHYDAAGELTAMTDALAGKTLASFGYTRDAGGQVTSESTTGLGAPTTTYTYTALNQLASVNGADLTYDPAGAITRLLNGSTLSYDTAGRLQSLTNQGATTTFSYDTAGDRTAQSGGPDTSPHACGICLLSPSAAKALTVSGNAAVTSNGVLTLDSAATPAIDASGKATVTAARIYAAGSTATTGAAQISPAPANGTATDPLQGSPPPAVITTPQTISLTTGAVTAQPGVYSSITVSGGAALNLAPGDYVLTGDVTLSGSAQLRGDGVTLYLTCTSYPNPCPTGTSGAGIRASGGATFALDGAADPSGITVFEDAGDTSPISLSGTPHGEIIGDLHAPSAPVSLSGHATLQVTGTLVADTLHLDGNATLDNQAPAHTLPGATYTYDGAHRLVSTTTPNGTSTYSYNGDGLRTDATTNGAAQHFTWDQIGANGLPTLLSDGTTNYIYDANGDPIEQINADGTVTYYLHDELGSTRLLTDGTGSTVASYTYSANGETTQATGTAGTPLLWGGQYRDPTGLYYLRSRYYDPATAQFISVDPLAETNGQPYSYAGGDPINSADPSGLCRIAPWHLSFWTKGNCLSDGADAAAGAIADAWDAGVNAAERLALSPVIDKVNNLISSVENGGNAATGCVAAVSSALRLPDYVSVEISGGAFGIVGGAIATITRYGDIYVGPELGAGIPGISANVEAGWIDQGTAPSRQALDSFVSANSITLGGYIPYPFGVAGPAAAEVWGNVGQLGWSNFSTQVGVGVGTGKNLALVWSYSFHVGSAGPRW